MAAGSITDVPGIRVGQAERIDDGWLSGVTVVLPPPDGAVAGVDVRGGGPGTRETDLLDPRNLVDRVHALVFTGGSALGLATVDGVVQRLLDAAVGFEVGEPGSDEVVPVVPAAVIFDLGRGGEFRQLPGPELGAAAYDAASGDVAEGNHGAGTGARAGGLKGGVGTVSATLPDGTVVGALAVVNAAGSTVDLGTGELFATRHCRPGDLPPLRRPDPADLDAAKAAAEREPEQRRPPLATTLVALATDATLTKAQCQKVSGHRPRRPGPGDQPGAHDGRRRHRVHAGHLCPRGRARSGVLPRAAGDGRRLRDPGGGAGDARGRVDPRAAELSGGVPVGVRVRRHTGRASRHPRQSVVG